jgi:iron-sulfur cluster assembly protein
VVQEEEIQSSAERLSLLRGETLLDSLLRNGIRLEHQCGGALACATCCVIVREGLETLSPAGDDELDLLDRAGASSPHARLSCQAVSAGGDVMVEVPQQDARQIRLRTIAAPVSVTEGAARHFAAQLERYPGASVRLSVEPAGCAGFAYKVDRTDAIRDDDTVYVCRGIRIVVDPASLPRVQGTTLDVVQDGLDRRLRFRNPNATETCGCGESFGT